MFHNRILPCVLLMFFGNSYAVLAQPQDSLPKPSKIELPALTVLPGKNPAVTIMEQVVAHKAQSTHEQLISYQFTAYNKLEYDFHNYSAKIRKKRLLKPIGLIFAFEDSSLKGIPFIPFGFNETSSEIYVSKSPPQKKQVILGSRISGIKDASVSQFLGDIYEPVFIYENYISIFDKNFISPLNDKFDRYYNYFLVDTVLLDSVRCYKLLFFPKNPEDLMFMGALYIHDSSYAVKKINIRINDKANINYIRQFSVIQDYTLIDGKYWMLTHEQSIGDIAPFEKRNGPGIFQRKLSSYSNFRFNEPIPASILNQRKRITVSDSAGVRSDAYWAALRSDSLNLKEKNISRMVDSIRNVRRLVNLRYFGQMLTTGFLHWKQLELGPYYTFVSWNTIEGVRLKVAGTTNSDFSKRLELRGMIAYGTQDKRVKSRAGVRWLFGKDAKRTTRQINVSYRNDLEQLSLSPNSLLLDNVLTSILRRTPLTQVTNVEEARIALNYEWTQGFSSILNLFNRRLVPLADFKFQQETESGIINLTNLTTTEVNLSTRWSIGENRNLYLTDRRYPLIQVDLGMGVPQVLNSGFSYFKTKIRFSNRINMRRFGYLDYLVDAGKYWGTAPYLFLEIHQGSQTYAFDPRSFNMMSIFEFVSDRFAYLFFDHHFEGFFLNKIPFLKNLKWREVITLKSVIGDMRKENLQQLIYPGGADPQLHRPYIESGFAIENIFKFLRIDALWRMTHHTNPGVQKFGLRASLIFKF